MLARRCFYIDAKFEIRSVIMKTKYENLPFFRAN